MAKREIIEGTIQGNERGYAFLIPDNNLIGVKDYFIPHSALKGAMHKDRVLAETYEDDGVKGERTTARVLKILSRGLAELAGTYFTCRSGGFVVPDDRKFFNDVFIPFGKGLKAKAGDKVICKILLYPKSKSPEGIICKVLGRQFDKKAEINSILFSYKLPDEFPPEVKAEAEKISDEIKAEDLKGRKDFRKDVTFTIDGEDARDFDDAVSIKIDDKGNYILGVHIADVSHYVLPKSPIDREAFNRATSVYFPEKVIPMLPEKLCNNVCSLKEGVDRLTLSCIITIDKKGNVLDKIIAPSIIKSSKRLTYLEVQKILDGDKKLLENNEKVYDSIEKMNDLCDVLIKKRDENGSIDLDVKESSIIVGKDGKIEITAQKRDKAHKIIEEFMILANVCVAEYMYFLEKPFIYRVHDKPSEEKLETLYNFLNCLGVKFKKNKSKVYSKDYQLILKSVENSPLYTIINRVMLRSMQKAKYSPDCIGHFGLSEEHYCHFTSPIRRYPDLVIHRIIKDFLAGNFDKVDGMQSFVEKASVQSSIKEKNAEEAERAVDDYYKLLYISNFVGEEFDGIISGVTNFGIFVELENGVEGLVKIENLPGKRYFLDEKNFTLSNGRYSYKLGAAAKINVAGVNFSSKRAEFILCN